MTRKSAAHPVLLLCVCGVSVDAGGGCPSRVLGSVLVLVGVVLTVGLARSRL